MRLLLALLAVAGALLNTSAGVAVVAAAGHANVVEPAFQLFHCDAATGAGARIAVRDVVECIARSSPTNIVFVHPTLRTPTVRLECKCVRPACATPVSVVGGPSADYECPKENLEKEQEGARKAAAKAAENARQQAEVSRKAAEHAARRAVTSAWTDRVANVEEEMNRGPDKEGLNRLAHARKIWPNPRPSPKVRPRSEAPACTCRPTLRNCAGLRSYGRSAGANPLEQGPRRATIRVESIETQASSYL